MSDYSNLIKRLRDYSNARKGEIAELTGEAADALERKSGEPKTNADRIRAMTDEELADVFDHVQGDGYLVGRGWRQNSMYPGADISWLDWLKQEVDA